MRLFSIFSLVLWGCLSLGAATLKPVVTDSPADLSVVSGAPDTVLDLTAFFEIDGVTGTIVRFDTVVGQINVELFDEATPVTVANFLDYTNQKSYDNSIIHRVEPGFVVQGGGFKLPVPATDLPPLIPAGNPIINEGGIPNSRGTLAMARTSELNSATTQWYFNLKDNTTLDDPSSPYAVFGRAIGSSLLVVDAIGAIQPYNMGFEPFLAFPLINPGTTLVESNYVLVRSIRTLPLYPAEGGGLSALIFTAVSSDSSLVAATVSRSSLLLDFDETRTGEATITLEAIDGDGNRATTGFLVTVRSAAPGITGQPLGRAVGIGESFELKVVAESETPLSYQWRKNGQSLTGATGSTLTLSDVQPAAAGAYDVVVTNDLGSVTSRQAFLTVTSEFGHLTNLSTRSVTSVEPPFTRTTPGFVIRGTGSVPVLARAIGPGLEDFAVGNFLADPEIRLSPLEDRLNVLAANDDWELSSNLIDLTAAFDQAGAFALKTGSKDAAVLASIADDAYTASILSVDGTTGVVLGEVYLVEDPVPGGAALVNLSNRGQVGAGAEVMIGGFAVAGSGPVNLLIRGIGPTLGGFGVNGVVEDPVLTVRDAANQVIGGNDDWEADGLGSALATTSASVGAFALEEGSRDAALLLVLDPGSYTVVLSGQSGGTGTGLVEIYLVR